MAWPIARWLPRITFPLIQVLSGLPFTSAKLESQKRMFRSMQSCNLPLKGKSRVTTEGTFVSLCSEIPAVPVCIKGTRVLLREVEASF